MYELLQGRFAPLTFSVGFLEMSLEAVARAYVAWTKSNHGRVDVRPVEGDLAGVLRELEPLTMPPRRKLLLATQSGWTAYFDNGTFGPDPRTPVSYLAEQLHCRGMMATNVPHTLHTQTGNARGTYGAVMFELFGPEPGVFLNFERTVCVTNDGGPWRFEAEGEVQPFEETAQYAARRIRDRFTPAMLERYCLALGVRLFDERFYGGPGMVVVVQDPPRDGAKEFSLAEAQKQLAITPS